MYVQSAENNPGVALNEEDDDVHQKITKIIDELKPNESPSKFNMRFLMKHAKELDALGFQSSDADIEFESITGHSDDEL